MRNRLIIIFFIVLVSLVIKILLYERPPLKESQVWIHRGGIPQNSIKGITQTIMSGKTKIEIDVRKVGSGFIISHDIPKPDEDPPKLKNILKLYRLSHIWIDYKEYNLFKNLLSGDQIKLLRNKKFTIETKSILTFLYLKLNGIQVFFWHNPERYTFSNFGFNFFLLKFFKLIGHSKLSMDIKYVDKYLLKEFNYNIFTVNDPILLQKLCKQKNIDIILSDQTSLGCY